MCQAHIKSCGYRENNISHCWSGKGLGPGKNTIQYGKYNYLGSTEHCENHIFQLDKVKAMFLEEAASKSSLTGERG